MGAITTSYSVEQRSIYNSGQAGKGLQNLAPYLGEEITLLKGRFGRNLKHFSQDSQGRHHFIYARDTTWGVRGEQSQGL